jgi:hypothetical protein
MRRNKSAASRPTGRPGARDIARRSQPRALDVSLSAAALRPARRKRSALRFCRRRAQPRLLRWPGHAPARDSRGLPAADPRPAPPVLGLAPDRRVATPAARRAPPNPPRRAASLLSRGHLRLWQAQPRRLYRPRSGRAETWPAQPRLHHRSVEYAAPPDRLRPHRPGPVESGGLGQQQGGE